MLIEVLGGGKWRITLRPGETPDILSTQDLAKFSGRTTGEILDLAGRGFIRPVGTREGTLYFLSDSAASIGRHIGYDDHGNPYATATRR